MKQNTAADKISGFESSCVALGEMRQIVEKFNAAADAYYNDRSELMTDFEWDALFDRLKVLEAESGVVLSDTPTVNVFADDVAGQKRDGLGQRLRQDELPHQQRRQLRPPARTKRRRNSTSRTFRKTASTSSSASETEENAARS